jgi:NIPSNAP
MQFTVAQEAIVPGGGEVIYVDTGGGPGSVVEILKPAPGTREFFRMMREAHRTWDGKNPSGGLGNIMAYYLLATLRVKYGQQQRFYEVMSHLKPALEREGWKLVGGYQTAIGPLNTVIDLWEVKNPGAVTETLAAVGRQPEFAKWAAQLPELLEEETLQLMTKVPYFS